MASIKQEAREIEAALRSGPANVRNAFKDVVASWKTPRAATVIQQDAGFLSRAGSGAGRVVAGAGSLAGKAVSGAGSLVGKVVSAPFAFFGSMGGEIAGSSANAGLKLVEQPVAWAMKPIKGSINLITKRPFVAGIVALVGGALYVGSHSRRKAAERTQIDAMNQMAQAGQGSNANANVTYQVTPEEQAAMEAKMRGGNNEPRTTHADTVLASRQQGTPVAGPAI